jgi:hypothetical protein
MANTTLTQPEPTVQTSDGGEGSIPCSALRLLLNEVTCVDKMDDLPKRNIKNLPILSVTPLFGLIEPNNTHKLHSPAFLSQWFVPLSDPTERSRVR